MLDFGWADWISGQVERVWDLLDISMLRSAKQGIDPAFKRFVDSLASGQCSSLMYYSQPSVELIAECGSLDWVRSHRDQPLPHPIHDSVYHESRRSDGRVGGTSFPRSSYR